MAHYIHLNPVRAGLLPAERLMDFKPSSLPLFAGPRRPAALAAATLLAESGGLGDTAAGWRRYLAYLGLLAEEETGMRDQRFGRLSRGWAIGSKEFKAELKAELAASGAALDRFALLGAEAGAQRELREELWEEKLRLAAKALGVRPEKLPAQKSAPEKVMLAAVLKTATSASNGWLAQRLRMGQPASVSQYVRRFRLAGLHQADGFKALLSKVKP